MSAVVTHAPAGGLSGLGRLAHRALRVLLGLVVLAMTAANAINAGMRYLAGTQMRGADELLAFSQVAIVMLGLALVTAERRHLAVDLWPRGGVAGAARQLALSLVTAAVCGYAALQSWDFVARMWVFDARSMALGLPLVIPNAFVLAGFALTALVALGLAAADGAALARALGGRR